MQADDVWLRQSNQAAEGENLPAVGVSAQLQSGVRFRALKDLYRLVGEYDELAFGITVFGRACEIRADRVVGSSAMVGYTDEIEARAVRGAIAY
jgi:hypothetical protein